MARSIQGIKKQVKVCRSQGLFATSGALVWLPQLQMVQYHVAILMRFRHRRFVNRMLLTLFLLSIIDANIDILIRKRQATSNTLFTGRYIVRPKNPITAVVTCCRIIPSIQNHTRLWRAGLGSVHLAARRLRLPAALLESKDLLGALVDQLRKGLKDDGDRVVGFLDRRS